jgi:hypothetical protein
MSRGTTHLLAERTASRNVLVIFYLFIYLLNISDKCTVQVMNDYSISQENLILRL